MANMKLLVIVTEILAIGQKDKARKVLLILIRMPYI
jgi:hypothetical protein